MPGPTDAQVSQQSSKHWNCGTGLGGRKKKTAGKRLKKKKKSEEMNGRLLEVWGSALLSSLHENVAL